MQGKYLLSSLTQTMWAILLLATSRQSPLASFLDPNSSRERVDVIPAATNLRGPRRSCSCPIARSSTARFPSAQFGAAAYLEQTGGYLGKQHEFLADTGETSAAGIVQRVASEFSINPRLLLALLEHECHCVRGQPANLPDSRNLLNCRIIPIKAYSLRSNGPAPSSILVITGGAGEPWPAFEKAMAESRLWLQA